MKMTSYLSTVKFDPNLRNTWWGKYLVNFRLVLLLTISIIGIGLVNYFNIPRRLNPEIKIPIVTIITALPGASPTDIESLVTVPLEDKLGSVKGLDTMTSSSQENVSAITLQFVSKVDAEKARQDTQALVDTATLPTDVKSPVVKALDFEDQPIWTFSLTTTTDTPSLVRFARVLKERIKNVQKVDRVTTSGIADREVQIIINATKLKEFGITPLTLSQAISKSTKSYPAGNINSNTSTISLSIDPAIVNVDDIRYIRLSAAGQVITVGDVATVIETTKLNQPTTYFANPKTTARPTVQFFVFRSSSANIDAAEKDVKKVVDDTVAEYGNRFQVVTVMNTAEEITKQFNDLIGEFTSTILLVFINLLLFLGLRQAIISSLTFPLSFLASITILNALGLTMNFLTMFAFLIALGLLIDDTIVTVAAVTRYHATGRFTPAETGMLVWRDFIVPLWSTTITTVWAFVPLLLASGIIGEFIKSIPIVVTATMLSSTAIAVLITLPLLIVILQSQLPPRVKILLKVLAALATLGLIFIIAPKDNVLYPFLVAILIIIVLVALRIRNTATTYIRTRISDNKYLTYVSTRGRKILSTGLFDTEKLSKRYMILIDRILKSPAARKRTLIMLVVFAILGYLLVPLGLVQNEFFPKNDQNILYVSVDLPAGTNIQTTQPETVSLANQLRKTQYLDFLIAETGTQLTGNNSRSITQESFLMTLHLLPKDKRAKNSQDIAEQIRTTFKNYNKGKFTVRELSDGPPAGSDIQIKLLGNDLGILDQNANKIVAFLEKQPGVTNVEKSIKPGTSKLVFVPDKNKLAENNISPDTLGLWLRTFASGFTLDKIKIEGDDTDIVMRLNETNLTTQDIGTLSITTPSGTVVPLLALGDLHLEPNPTVITREGGKRALSVSAGVTKGFVIVQKNKDLEQFANTKLNLPPGYEWKTGGVNEENTKSINSILQAMALSFLLILATMVIEFGSYRQALLTLLTIPLAIPGVFYIFALTGTPLSFPALIGILALFGIVITNAIVVVEKINDNRKHGMNLHDSIVDASGSRLEPILLTSITSILGLIPITLSDPLWRGLGGAIIAGLLFSGAVKLFFIPIVYYTWYKDDEKV